MRIQIILIIAVLTFFVGPLSADHRHGRDCGHHFDSHRGSWISVHAIIPLALGTTRHGFAQSPYRQGYGYDSHRSRHNKRYWKQVRKQQQRFRRNSHRRGHHHGPQRRR